MIKRTLEPYVKKLAKNFPVIAVLGPRQSGKTTLVKAVFPQHGYVSLEDYDIREHAKKDPRSFLATANTTSGLILDEIQHVPELLSYMQTIVDSTKQYGQFILTGSQNILVNEAITQSLAGRMAIVRLLPLSINELEQAHLLPESIESAAFYGSYPRIYADKIEPSILYKNYIDTYLERDIRQIQNITNLARFQRFLQICASRTGQILNLASLGNDCDIDQKTVRAWLSVLEATYIITRLQPYHKNFGKRLIKSPKMYFLDTGLACSLLGITTSDELSQHYLRGNLVETFIIADLFKQCYNLDIRPPLYFWRDQKNEVDCIVEQALKQTAIEIKAGRTVNADFFTQIEYWRKTTKLKEPSFIVYAGDQDQTWSNAQVLSWKSAGKIIEQLYK